MPAIELIIFDSDGTLMDTEIIASKVEVEALAEYGFEMTPKEFGARFAGMNSTESHKIIEEEIGRSLPDDHFEKVSRKMKERFWRDVKAIDGAHAVLDMLDQPRCICSNSEPEKLKISLTKGELWDRFRPFIYSAYDFEDAKKPKPDLFLHAAREFEVGPRACAVIEDSVSGVTGAKAAGMRVIGFTGGAHSWPGHADMLTDAGAETVIDKLVHIPELLKALGEWDGVDG